MKSFLIPAAATVLLAACASRDPRLEGRWKSNRALTVATFEGWKTRSAKTPSPRQCAFLAALFGRLVVTYEHGTVRFEMPSATGQSPYRHRSRYRVVASDCDSLAYVSTDPVTRKPEISHVYFDGPNRY